MSDLKRWILAVLPLTIFLACGGAEQRSKSVEQASGALTQTLWQEEEGSIYTCADVCDPLPGVPPNCNCAIFKLGECPLNVTEGAACSQVGQSCNKKSGSSNFVEFNCETVVTAPPVLHWQVANASSCADSCNGTCNCLHPTCSKTQIGQTCTSAGATCTAIAGPNFDTLRCQ